MQAFSQSWDLGTWKLNSQDEIRIFDSEAKILKTKCHYTMEVPSNITKGMVSHFSLLVLFLVLSHRIEIMKT